MRFGALTSRALAAWAYGTALALCLALLGAGVYRTFDSSPKLRPRELLVGKVLPNPPHYRWGSHPLTLVLALRVGCPFCEASVPFYQHLILLAPRSRVHLLALFPDDPGAVRLYLGERKMGVDFRAQIHGGAYGLAQTPTLLLVDGAGRVEYFWVGMQDSAGRSEIIQALTRSHSSLSSAH